jgi:hypothetical protein
LEIQSGEHGSVATKSESFVCASGSKCTLDIESFDFEETFYAIPEKGYRFKEWKRGKGYFCGGLREHCPLSTASFSGNALLEEVLYSDQPYYLEPVFERESCAAVAGGYTWNPGETVVVRKSRSTSIPEPDMGEPRIHFSEVSGGRHVLYLYVGHTEVIAISQPGEFTYKTKSITPSGLAWHPKDMILLKDKILFSAAITSPVTESAYFYLDQNTLERSDFFIFTNLYDDYVSSPTGLAVDGQNLYLLYRKVNCFGCFPFLDEIGSHLGVMNLSSNQPVSTEMLSSYMLAIDLRIVNGEVWVIQGQYNEWASNQGLTVDPHKVPIELFNVTRNFRVPIADHAGQVELERVDSNKLLVSWSDQEFVSDFPSRYRYAVYDTDLDKIIFRSARSPEFGPSYSTSRVKTDGAGMVVRTIMESTDGKSPDENERMIVQLSDSSGMDMRKLFETTWTNNSQIDIQDVNTLLYTTVRRTTQAAEESDISDSDDQWEVTVTQIKRTPECVK